jgi:4-hydroxy-tetrahydrodipicolinate synthase
MDTNWNGVFPAITTQMHRDGSLNLEGTAAHAEALIRSGVSGIIFLGSLGENQTLTPEAVDDAGDGGCGFWAGAGFVGCG